MSRSSAFTLLGALIVLVPVSGMPIAARTVFLTALGAIVLGIGIMMRAETARASRAALPTRPADAPRAETATPAAPAPLAEPPSEPLAF